MRYFVLAEDGNKYGPADVPLLNSWIEEGRLLPRMMLEEEGSQHRVTAASVQGLDFYVLDSAPTPQEAAQVATLAYDPPTAAEAERVDMFLAWSMVFVTLIFAAVRPIAGFLGIFTALLGMMAGVKAKERGHELASASILVNMLALVIWAASRVYFIIR